MNKLILLSVVVAVATGINVPPSTSVEQQPPCQTAAQWEGRASEWDHVQGRNNRFLISFDGVGLRKRVIEEKKSFMPGRRFYEYLMEYKTNTMYTINMHMQTCNVSQLKQPWQNHTIPPDATLEDEYEMGDPGSGLHVQEWSDRLPARRSESWIGIYTPKTENGGCWPVVEVFTDDTTDPPVSLTTRFFDITPGIKNMSVFVPPSFCPPSGDFEPPITNQYVEIHVENAENYGPIYTFYNYIKSWF